MSPETGDNVAKPQLIHDVRKAKNGNGGDKWQQGIAEERKGAICWADAGSEDLHAAIAAVTEDGAALLLSKTSDGGALSIHVLTEGATHKLYPADQAALNAALELLTRIAGA